MENNVVLLEHLVKAYVYLVKAGRRTIEEIPEEYRDTVAERIISTSK